MRERGWQVDDQDEDELVVPESMPLLVSLHFLRAALRRRWLLWTSFALVGLVLGVFLSVGVAAKSDATTTLLLAHDPGKDPTLAMATDVSMLSTRTLAGQVIDDLHLSMTPEKFLESFTATAVTSDVLQLTVSAPTQAESVARARTLAADFLTFRAAQMNDQSQALVDGYTKRITALQGQVDTFTRQYNQFSGQGPSGSAAATDALTQRSQIEQEISALQQTVEDTTLQTSSIVGASHVLDPASATPHSAKKRAVLGTASGLIGGTVVGVGLVLFMAITSNRLRRRDEVAAALGAPVRYSVGRVRTRILPLRRVTGRSRAARELQLLIGGLDATMRQRGGRRSRLIIATPGDCADARIPFAALAADLAAQGLGVVAVDLTEDAQLGDVLKRVSAARERVVGSFDRRPVVYRPEGVPSLFQGPLAADRALVEQLPQEDPRRVAVEAADVVLTLAEIHPGLGADHLRPWADRVVLLVGAGQASAERLRTTGELVRSAGLDLMFAVMVGADRGDESLGRSETPEPDQVLPTRRTSVR